MDKLCAVLVNDFKSVPDQLKSIGSAGEALVHCLDIWCEAIVSRSVCFQIVWRDRHSSLLRRGLTHGSAAQNSWRLCCERSDTRKVPTVLGP